MEENCPLLVNLAAYRMFVLRIRKHIEGRRLMWQGWAVWLSLAAVGRVVKVWEEGLHYLGVGVATKKQNKTKPGNSNNQEMTEQWK